MKDPFQTQLHDVSSYLRLGGLLHSAHLEPALLQVEGRAALAAKGCAGLSGAHQEMHTMQGKNSSGVERTQNKGGAPVLWVKLT